MGCMTFQSPYTFCKNQENRSRLSEESKKRCRKAYYNADMTETMFIL